MIEEVYEAYLLSREEFSILLRAAGCRAFYGFPMEAAERSRKELLLELHRMVKKGLMRSDGVGFVTEPALLDCIRAIAEAENMLLVTVQVPSLPVYCCYPGRQIFICEWMNRRADHIKLKRVDREKFFGILAEEGYFPALGKGSYQLIHNHTGVTQRKLTLQRNGLEQTFMLEEKEKQMQAVYSEETLGEMFRALAGGEFYDIS